MNKKNLLWLMAALLLAMPMLVACGGDDDNDEISSNPTEQGGKYDKPHAPKGVVAVDLGLPSGTKWANMNVGATKPEEYGDYFRWAETTPFVEGDTKDSYPYMDVDLGESIAGTKYDAATANWGKPWKMPTDEQIEELLAYCGYTWTTQDRVNGAKVTGPNGASIFFPASGTRNDDLGMLGGVGSSGYCWSASAGSDYAGRGLYFYSGLWWWSYSYRTYGFSVRAVTE